MTKKQKKQLLSIILASVVLAAVFFITRINMPWYFEALLYILPYLTVGLSVLKKAFKNLISGQMLDENFLMAIATVGAFLLKEYTEAVFVMLFYQVGEFFESIAVGKSRKSISDLMEICPEEATVLRNGEALKVLPEEVLLDETVLVKAGEKIPLDGVVIKGTSSLDTSKITGESLPQNVEAGDTVVGGTVNINGVLEIRVTKLFQDSTVAKILELVENTQKAKSERFIDKFSKYYTPIVVLFALLLAIFPSLIWGNWSDWIHRGLIVLVVSCPCALVLSVPLSYFAGIGGASKQGILIKGAEYLEKLAKTQNIVFDKTGTLTKGSFKISEITGDKTLYYLASAEQYSNHPVALSIKKEYKGDVGEVTDVVERAGYGIEATVDGKRVVCGNYKMFADAQDKNGVYVSVDGAIIGKVDFIDEIKEETFGAIAEIKASGVKNTFMLTGDSLSAAQKVADEAGIDSVKAQLLPDDKVACLEEILKTGTTVYVGDGINDAPVLLRADVGIAMGAFGTDAAIEASDVVLMNDSVLKIVTLLGIAKKTQNIVYTNIIFSLLVKITVLLLSAFSVVGMEAAIFADVGVLILAVLNAMRGLAIDKRE